MPKLADLARYIAANAEESLPLVHLAERVHLSPSRLQRVFKSIFGVSPKKFQQLARSQKFKSLLRSGAEVTDAIFASGYGSTSRVYESKIDSMGMTPKKYRAGGEGELITWACRQTVLGPLLMAATDRGVCFAQFGDDSTVLEKQLQDEFPQAELKPFSVQVSQPLDRWIDAFNAYIDNQQPRPDLPLDLRGTAFQVKVWEFLLSLTEGDVISYSKVAEAIDKPKAVRAAASACGANKIAVLVPCHRILRGDGGLGGYRWGLDRKRALLASEQSKRST